MNTTQYMIVYALLQETNFSEQLKDKIFKAVVDGAYQTALWAIYDNMKGGNENA